MAHLVGGPRVGPGALKANPVVGQTPGRAIFAARRANEKKSRRRLQPCVALFGRRSGTAGKEATPPVQVVPESNPASNKVHVPSSASAVAAGLVVGVLAYLTWSKFYEYWKRTAPHHADKNDPGPFGGALVRGPPPPKDVQLSPRNLEQVEVERVLALRELQATHSTLQEELRRVELLRGQRTSYLEQLAAAQATLRQLGPPSSPQGPAAERAASLEGRIAELRGKLTESEQSVRAAEALVDQLRSSVSRAEGVLDRLDKRAAELGAPTPAEGSGPARWQNIPQALSVASGSTTTVTQEAAATDADASPEDWYDDAIELMRRELAGPSIYRVRPTTTEPATPATSAQSNGASPPTNAPHAQASPPEVDVPRKTLRISKETTPQALPEPEAPPVEALLSPGDADEEHKTLPPPEAALAAPQTLSDPETPPMAALLPPGGADDAPKTLPPPKAAPPQALPEPETPPVEALLPHGDSDAGSAPTQTSSVDAPTEALPAQGSPSLEPSPDVMEEVLRVVDTLDLEGAQALYTSPDQADAPVGASVEVPEGGWTAEALQGCIAAAEDDLETLRGAVRARMGPREAEYELDLRAKVTEAQAALLDLERSNTPEAMADIPKAVSRLDRQEESLRQLYEGLMRPEERAQAQPLHANLATWRAELDALFSASRTAQQAKLEEVRKHNAKLRRALEAILASLDQPGLTPGEMQSKMKQLQMLREEMAMMLERSEAVVKGQLSVEDLNIGGADALAVIGGKIGSLDGDGIVTPDEADLAAALDQILDEREADARDMLAVPDHRKVEEFAHGGRSIPDQGPMTLHLLAGGASIPHPDKVEAGGEDAHFVAGEGLGAAGVADGVGGWAAEGFDSGEYSRRLMRNALDVLQATVESDRTGVHAREVIQQAHEGVGPIHGSTTALLALVRPGGLLEVANVGDSGFRLLRNGSVVYASEVQQHEFNCPYQLGSPELVPETDTADDAVVYELDAEQGDILVLGTDGLFDNMWNDELERIVNTHLQFEGRTAKSATNLAHKLVEAAARNQANTQYRSPWAVEAAAAGRLPLWQRLSPKGGKKDDCTVVVGFLEGLPAADKSNAREIVDPQPAAAA